MTEQQIEKAAPTTTIEQYVERNADQILKSVPASVIDKGRLLRLALNELRLQPKLRQCTVPSLLHGIVRATSLGLEMGLGNQAWLVPFNKSVKVGGQWTKQLEATLMLGYGGLAKLAKKGDIAALHVSEVREGDEYDRNEMGMKHRWDPFDANRLDRPIIGVYAGLETKSGAVQWTTMSKAEVDAVRDRSRAKDDGPWVTDYCEMAKKTVLKRGLKLSDLTSEAMAVIQEGDEAEFGVAERVDAIPDGTASLAEHLEGNDE